MRQVVYSVAMSLDGYIAGPHGESDWIVIDPEIDFDAMFARFDVIVMGRKTYELTRTQQGASMPGVASYVFSQTLTQADCRGVTVSDDPLRTIPALKNQQGRDIWLFGGGELFRSLLELGLVDRISVAIVPVLLGGGLPLLPDSASRAQLRLEEQHIYPKTGTVSLEYSVARNRARRKAERLTMGHSERVPVIGLHCSHEQIHPSELLAAAQQAEQVGFTAAMCSDHISPWSERQGHSAFAWSWLGAALQSTGLPFGVVNAPGQRYHPAIIGQAIGTLGAMYEGRFWAALGTGENSNEHITGGEWPRKDLRNARLRECVDIIRALLAGEEVTHDGLVTVDRAKVWTRPKVVPLLIGAAVTPQTAQWAATWADGLITIDQPPDVLREMINGYRNAGGKGPLAVQIHLSYASTQDEALAIAYDQWRTNTFAPPVCWDLETVEAFDVASVPVRAEDVAKSVFVSADIAVHTQHLADLVELGFDELYLHHVGQTQTEFIEVFGERVLPELSPTSKI